MLVGGRLCVGRRKNGVENCGREGERVKANATALAGLEVEYASWRKAQPTS